TVARRRGGGAGGVLELARRHRGNACVPREACPRFRHGGRGRAAVRRRAEVRVRLVRNVLIAALATIAIANAASAALIDRSMPAYQFRDVSSVVIAAPPARVIKALET